MSGKGFSEQKNFTLAFWSGGEFTAAYQYDLQDMKMLYVYWLSHGDLMGNTTDCLLDTLEIQEFESM